MTTSLAGPLVGIHVKPYRLENDVIEFEAMLCGIIIDTTKFIDYGVL